ncbi:nucleotidyl transferase AbiEii/AbiGii toxin family protein [Facklamia sp. P13055]|uniref:nucleotidyl transferase AbiEii/AbiGii toxin family protein n=1 Tax=unclassified Facklamia TaxID=2622293 RepID=UPI003D1805CF
MYFFERVLERLEKSFYRHSFIIKGGLLISSLIGIDNRTTKDIDATVRGITLTEENITKIVKEILAIDVQDGIDFVFEGVREIRESDEYENYRISFSARYGRINNPMKMDITTGDAITPKEMIYQYPLMFDEGHVEVMAYPLETILAEKIETIIRRNIATTRMRDFYDIYLLRKLYGDKINFKTLARAIENTSKKRESLDDLADYKEILEDISSDDYLKQHWQNYLQDNPYIGEVELDDTLDVLSEIFQKISN